ncbi:MAG: phosphatidate cytidylyltransferase [bacterium]|nr:phosphatidate cytidylyltransferase [bacterium]
MTGPKEWVRMDREGDLPPAEADDNDGDEQDASGVDQRSDTEEFTDQDYVRSTTREYRGLAESVAKAGEESYEQSAVAARVPGLGTSVVGFKDMTGQDEEDPEQLEEIDRARRSELAMRIITGLAVVAVFFGALYAGPLYVTVLLGLLVIIALIEFYLAVRSAGFAPVGLIGALGALGVLYTAWVSGPFGAAGIVGAVILATGLWFVVLPRRYPLANIGVTVLGVAWVAMMASFAIPVFRSPQAWSLTTALVVFTALNDIAAFSYGRAFGSRKLAPVLSPNKTVEGFVGATVVTVLAGLIVGRFGLLEPLTMNSAIALAVVISVFGPIGDLSESAVKRAMQIKDMGSSLPGHGGVLDRLDAFLFTIPATYLVYVWFGYL